MDTVGLKNRSVELIALFKTITGILFLDLNCPTQFLMASNFINNVIAELHFFVSDECERETFLLFLNYLKKFYLTPTHNFFLGKVSNFQQELLGDFFTIK